MRRCSSFFGAGPGFWGRAQGLGFDRSVLGIARKALRQTGRQTGAMQHINVGVHIYVHARYPCRKAHAPGWQAWWGGEDLSWQRRPTWEIAKLGEILKRCQAMKIFQHRHHFFSTIIILMKGDFNDLHDLRRQPSRSSLMSTFSQGVKDKFAVGFLFLFWSTFYTFC